MTGLRPNTVEHPSDNGTTPAPRLIHGNSVVPTPVTHRCPGPVFPRAVQPHSCAPWAQPCVRGGCGSSKHARISQSAAGCLNLQLSGSKPAIPVLTCSAWSRSQRRWRFRCGPFCDVRRGGSAGVAMEGRRARAAARRPRSAADSPSGIESVSCPARSAATLRGSPLAIPLRRGAQPLTRAR
jgi:hypothetical protein